MSSDFTTDDRVEQTRNYPVHSDDFSVPEPIAERTEIKNLSDVDGFEFNGCPLDVERTVPWLQDVLVRYHEPSDTSETGFDEIELWEAANAMADTLAASFSAWFEGDEHQVLKPDIYGPIGYGTRLPGFSGVGAEVSVKPEDQMPIINAAVALMVAEAQECKAEMQADEKEDALREVRKAVGEAAQADAVERDDVEAIVERTFDHFEE